jgi:lysozyme family protein
MPSPYLWAGTDIYRSGKYVADGRVDPDAVSKSIGAAAILKALFTRGAIDLR